jgi:asparagine synthase (glutamine-hydrolysing)
VDDPRAQVDLDLIEAMTAALAHRGPDGKGTYIHGPIAMGHTRLSIIDLATGDQPIYNEDRSVAIVFNGEIYNYKELRQELLQRGHRFATESDTEVIVHLYEDLGDRCVDSLNGMFAFAIWDAKRSRVFAARDRLGERPLYYCQHRDRLLFASELKAILRDPSVPREIALESLDDYLAYGYIPAPGTIFQGIRKLCAGECLVWEQGRLTTHPYWSVQFPAEPRRDEAAYIEELRALLDDSVRLRLRADVPVGALLSGGLDSNGVVALASLQLERPLQTFSVGFAETEFDELALARLTAERYRTDHHEITVSATDLSVFGDLVEHFDEPFGDPSALPTYYIAREARRFVKVCISGDGGDEVFAGYRHYPQALRDATVDRIPEVLRRAVFGAAAALVPDHVRGKGLLRRLAASSASRYQRRLGVFALEERHRLLQPDIARAVCSDARLFEEYFRGDGRDALSTFQLVDQKTYLPEDVLVKVDRAAMKSALEVRIPFLDHRVVELVNAMPADLKIRGGTQKYILRRLLRHIVPPEILAGRKRGFGIPIKHWFRGELRAFARERLLSPSSRNRRFLRPAAVEGLLASHDRGGRDLSDRIWTLLVLEEWCRRSGV